MTARKPAKPKPRKGCKPTLEQRMASLLNAAEVLTLRVESCEYRLRRLEEIGKRIDALETRAHFRDASHDEPVSNAGEAIGQHFRILPDAPRVSWWRRFWNFMGSAS